MGRVIKWLITLAFIAGILFVASYAGAFFRAGALIGTNTAALGTRHVELNYHGVPNLPGKPIAWVFTYRPTQLPGVAEARIYVSPTAKVIATFPRDLAAELDAWHRSQGP